MVCLSPRSAASRNNRSFGAILWQHLIGCRGMAIGATFADRLELPLLLLDFVDFFPIVNGIPLHPLLKI
jgi:hypothetical protein